VKGAPVLFVPFDLFASYFLSSRLTLAFAFGFRFSFWLVPSGFAFCLLPSAFCLLPSAFCLLPSFHRQPQNGIRLRELVEHSHCDAIGFVVDHKIEVVGEVS
jgi:hypothetical protein